MTIHSFQKNQISALRTQVIDMENATQAMASSAISLGLDEAFMFQIGRTAQASKTVACALRDFIQEIEAMEKAAQQLGLNITGDTP